MYRVIADDLTGPEQRLWAAFARGSWTDLGTGDPAADDARGGADWGPQRAVRAEVIAALLRGAQPAEPGRTPAVRLRGAQVNGELDLAGAVTAGPLVCEACWFEAAPRLGEAVTRTVRIAASRLPGFDGTRLRLDGALDFQGSEVGGVIQLDGAKVTGRLSLREVTVGRGEAAVHADGLDVDGSVDATALRAHGYVRLQGARVTGLIDLTGARLTGSRQRALTLSSAVISGRLRAAGIHAEGEIRMHNTQVGASIGLGAARLSNPGGVALSAGGLDVAGGVFCTDGFTADGEVRLIGARLGANLTLAGAVLRNPGQVALNLDRATVGDCDAAAISCTGQLRCTSARITSGLNLADARLDSGSGLPALAADGLAVDGLMQLSRVQARGELNFRTSRVGQRVLLTDARVDNPGGVALRWTRAEIGADLYADRLAVTGQLKLVGTRISGTLSLAGARLAGPAENGYAVSAQALEAGQLILVPAPPVEGTVDLSQARIGHLVDDPACWPEALDLGGLTYQALDPLLPASERLRWLARHRPGSGRPGSEPAPYEQLAAHYTAMGLPGRARQVLYMRERVQRAAKAPLGRAWSLLQDITVGYGYQPWKAGLWLIVALAAGSAVFGAHPPPPVRSGPAPHFIPVIYTLDLLLPVVNLGQKYAFDPAGAEQWLSYALVAAGWLLATTIAAGVARVLSRS
jgi:hypothetical protein